ncbi:macro domain-containing protein [Salinirubellus salinus]|uniref:Macro domain-containing protein n=1 Tax=Salinirubellus salinus TaxID=1364945 RepID=A0A9E7UBF6_9EURY|nr:macro domain-containing protein [Salinirubellus salinus]UWM55143.1 macro domain-containing protein [Salinirubellus salinus]
MEFEVIRGDITAQSVDAIVNAANTHLRMGGGVAGAIREAAGPAIQTEATERGPIGLGEAIHTDGYDLPAAYVVHAATMEPGGRATERSIRDATRNALAEADALGCSSVVLPALGCGIAGFDLKHGARVLFEELAAYEPATLESVAVVGYGESAFETLSRVGASVRD